MKHWTQRYIGIPFLPVGRTMTGVDCYGLAYIIYLSELGITLPSYVGAYASAEELAEIDAEISVATASDVWVAVSRAQPFDVAVFRVGEYRRHLGIVVSAGMMIHAHDDCAKIEHYAAPKWEHRLIGTYRHAQMALRAVP